MDFTTIIAYLFGAIILYITIWIFYKPLLVLMKYVKKTAIGCLCIFAVNLVTEFIGISIGVNLVTSMVAGILGLPGLALLIVLQQFL